MTAIIAHRGASEDAPENTLTAFQLAWKQGADAVEMDLRLSRDGRMAVIHDADLRRVAGIERSVSDLTADELRRIDVGEWKTGCRGDDGVPLLGEVLATVPVGRRVFLELKEGTKTLPELRRCIAYSGLASSQISVIAFDRSVLTGVGDFLSNVELGWIVDWSASANFERMVGLAANDGLHALDFSASWPLDEKMILHAQRAGLKVYVWTVNDPEIARRFADIGVDGITTDTPGRIRAALQ